MQNRVGQQLGNYRLIRLLGRGGFAEVYLGEHIFIRRPAAIKVQHTQLIEAEVEQFRKEAETIAHLEHPNIIQVLDFGLEDSTPYLVMNYAPNGSLAERHPPGTPLPAETIVSYVKQVASALQYAHNQKLIHRDVKPENMLISAKNEVLLSDFGIATIAHSSYSWQEQKRIGTTSYMSPEQIQRRAQPASDQYSLGIVVYQWLCGTPPFIGDEIQLIYQHIHVAPPPLREQNPAISPTVEQVILKVLAKDPQQRFSSVQEFANTFERAYAIEKPPTVISPIRIPTPESPRPFSAPPTPKPANPASVNPVSLSAPKPATPITDAKPASPRSETEKPLAEKNPQYPSLYSDAQEALRQGDTVKARQLLKGFWKSTPKFGDPEGLARRTGLERYRRVKQSGAGNSFWLWVDTFSLFGGVGTAVGVFTQSWQYAIAAVVVTCILAYSVGFRKVLSPLTSILIALISAAAAYSIGQYAAGFNYAAQATSYLLYGNRTLWLGRQIDFGFILGAISMVIYLLVAIDENSLELAGAFLFMAALVGYGLWVVVSGVIAIFGLGAGYGFGSGWQFGLLSLTISLFLGLGIYTLIVLGRMKFSTAIGKK